MERRSFLRLGSSGLLGIPLSLETILLGQARAEETGGPGNSVAGAKAKSVIFLFLRGGLSTIDTFDLKENAPREIRGPFKSIPTNIPGTRVCEHLPLVAKTMDKFSLVRSFTHSNSSHGPADHYMLTGYLPGAGFNAGLNPNNLKPSHGSIISRLLGSQGSTPPYICLPDHHPSAGPAYLGGKAAPFVIGADPNAADFEVPDLAPPLSIDSRRLSSRTALLKKIDKFHRSIEGEANRDANAFNLFRKKAFELMTSREAKKAFSIEEESESIRDAYGRHSLGQCCLMSRRLVEAGVRCVLIDHSNWDTHEKQFPTLTNELLPQLDTAMSTLFTDLADKGLLESTLVVITGEFGRTPKINNNAGRDHWGPAFTVMLGGGGIQGGRVIGKTTPGGDKPAEDPYGPEDLAATMYHLLGIDPEREFYTREQRPVTIVNNGRLIRELL